MNQGEEMPPTLSVQGSSQLWLKLLLLLSDVVLLAFLLELTFLPVSPADPRLECWDVLPFMYGTRGRHGAGSGNVVPMSMFTV